MRFCPMCGHTLTDAENFCPQCGSAVAAPPPPPPPPPMYTAPVSPLMRDLKTCVVGLVVSVVYLVLSILQLTVPDFDNEWVSLLSQLLVGGAMASYVFAAVHCKPAVAFLATIPHIAFLAFSLIHTLVEVFDYYSYYDHYGILLLELVAYYVVAIAVPVVTVLIVSVLRKRRPPEMVQSTAILVVFGLRVLADIPIDIIFYLIPWTPYGEFNMYEFAGLNGELYFWEVVGFAAVFLVSWLLLKNRKSRLRH